MALRGSLAVEVDVKSSAEKMWKILGDPFTYYLKVMPDYYKNFHLVQGSSLAPGTAVFVTYGKDFPVETATEKITAVDDPNKSFSYSMTSGIEDSFKKFEGTFLVIPKAEGSTVKFSCEFEKTKEEVPDPISIKDFKVKNFKEIDAYILKNDF